MCPGVLTANENKRKATYQNRRHRCEINFESGVNTADSMTGVKNKKKKKFNESFPFSHLKVPSSPSHTFILLCRHWLYLPLAFQYIYGPSNKPKKKKDARRREDLNKRKQDQ